MRLIDADELIERAARDKLDTRELILKMIRSAPTVDKVWVVSWRDDKLVPNIAIYGERHSAVESYLDKHNRNYNNVTLDLAPILKQFYAKNS